MTSAGHFGDIGTLEFLVSFFLDTGLYSIDGCQFQIYGEWGGFE